MRALALAVLLVVATTSAARADRIRAIDVVENTKTSDETVILIAGIEKGDKWDMSMIDSIKIDLVSSGLFKFVDVYSTPVHRGVKVTIIARDKHSWVIAPTVYNQPTNKGAGIGFGENNLFGENKKLLLYGQVATGDSFFIGAYVDPSIKGTRWKWQYDVFLRRERVIEYTVPQSIDGEIRPARQSKINYLNSGAKIGINLFRGASLDLRLRGARVFYDDVVLADPNATVADVTDDPSATADNLPAPGKEGWDVSTEVILQYDRRANWYGISSGDKYRVTFERALTGLGSDFDYWYSWWSWQRARKYFSRHNLITKASFVYGHNVPFQQEFTSGGTDLRGYKNRALRGNLRAAAKAEYSVPFFTIKGFALRGLAFWDTTYTRWFRSRDNLDRNFLPNHDTGSRLAGFKNSVGLGTRIYLRQVVLPLLGLDIGYGLENRAKEIYFAVGLTDF